MINRLFSCFVATLFFVTASFSPGQDADVGTSQANGQPAGNAAAVDTDVTFRRMDSDQVRTEVFSWLATTGQDTESLKKVTEQWTDDQTLAELSGEELLDLAVSSFASCDRATQRLLETSFTQGPLESVVYDGIRASDFYQNQVSLLHGRWLTQHRFYDDALPLLEKLDPDSVVDPAGLLFYKAVCQAELLERKDALDTLALLLNNTLDVPHRFQVIAEMMTQDLNGQSEEGMQQVERLMKDVERRLEIGESGKSTQKQGDAIISALDKMLEEMEKQNQQQDGGGGQGSNPQNQPGQQGASESQIKGGSANGEADRKNLEGEGSWGMMDQKAEAKARELIRGRLPANFLDQIGRFSKKLAEQK